MDNQGTSCQSKNESKDRCLAAALAGKCARLLKVDQTDRTVRLVRLSVYGAAESTSTICLQHIQSIVAMSQHMRMTNARPMASVHRPIRVYLAKLHNRRKRSGLENSQFQQACLWPSRTPLIRRSKDIRHRSNLGRYQSSSGSPTDYCGQTLVIAANRLRSRI